MEFIFMALILTVLTVGLSKEKWLDGNRVNASALTSTVTRFGGFFLLAALLLSLGTRAVVIVPAGHRGVIFNRMSGVRQQALKEGFNLVFPMVEQVYMMDVRVQKTSHDATAASKDLQIVHTKVALNFHPQQDTVHMIFQQVGLEYSERIIQPSIQEAIKATTSRFTAEELVTRREDVKNLIRDLMEKQISPFHIHVDELYITDFEFSRQFAEAIETKQIAEQQALKAKRDLDRIKIEAEQKIASARAEAESLKMQRDAISAQMIQLRQVETQKLAIEKWDGHMPSVILGGGATPLLDLGSLSQKIK